MGRRIAAKITGVAGYVPPRVVTNLDLEKRVDTSDEWIRTRTGIRERHYADPGVASSHLGAEAARKVLATRGVSPDDVGLIVVATVTPDMLFPATRLPHPGSHRREERLGLRSLRRLLRLPLRPHRRRAIRRQRRAPKSASHRQ